MNEQDEVKQEIVMKVIDSYELEEIMQKLGIDHDYLWEHIEEKLKEKKTTELLKFF